MGLHVVVLAAGQGSRMKSKLPKVLHPLSGKPLLGHVLDTAKTLEAEGIHIVVGHGAEQVKKTYEDEAVSWYLQDQQLGTAHAVEQAIPGVPDDATVLVLYGDVPLTKLDTLAKLVASVAPSKMSLLTVQLKDPTGYGRIIRGSDASIKAIVEHKDASEEQLQISEGNSGILAISASDLKDAISKIGNDNAQGEYYLTDVIELMVASGNQVVGECANDEFEVLGVNNRQQLSQLERWHQSQIATDLMMSGVTLLDPNRIDIRGLLECEGDVSIDVNCVFEGNNKLAEGVIIGPNCIIKNSVIGPNTTVSANSIIEDATIADSANIGPFARIRPGTKLASGAKIGNFVETKKANIGKGSKVNHLSYIGDATIGEGVNIGAGTITCNYDGVNKFQTVLGDGVFIGSNSSLVAPLTIEKDATVGAGSTITGSVQKNQLAVARGKQRNIDGWKKPTKK